MLAGEIPPPPLLPALRQSQYHSGDRPRIQAGMVPHQCPLPRVPRRLRFAPLVAFGFKGAAAAVLFSGPKYFLRAHGAGGR